MRILPETFDSSKKKATSAIFAAVFCLAWILPGLVGHDPWKADEAYSFGLVHSIMETGDWVVPSLADEPFMEKPPLYYVTAAGFARALSPFLPEHDGARLASAFYLILALIFAWLAGNELWGSGAGWIAVLSLIGCPSLLYSTHMLITDVSLFAGFAIALYGIAICRRRSLLGGILIGTGTGIGFLSKGLIAPGLIGITVAALPAASPSWRTRVFARSAGIAAAASLPWLIVWPLALYGRSPELFRDWFWINNLGRFAGFARLGPAQSPGFYLGVLPYFAFPMLPLAFLTVYRAGGEERLRPGILFPLCAAAVFLAVLVLSSDARELYALPLLLPLSLLAPPAVSALRPKTAAFLERIVAPLFWALSAAMWIGWAVLWSGAPAAFLKPLRDFAPAYVPKIHGTAIAAAAAYTLFGIAASRGSGRNSDGKSLLFRWAAGVTTLWGITMTLWLPMIDSGKTYRGLIADLSHSLPERHAHIASRNLGEPQRALLDYFAGIHTERVEKAAFARCDFLLVQCSRQQEIEPGPQWRPIWEGSRAGDAKELFRLYRRMETEKIAVKLTAVKASRRLPTPAAERGRETRSP